MTIGQRIRNRRIELDLSVAEVAAELNKHRSTIHRYEADAIEDLPTSVLEPLASVLKTTPAYLMGWTDDVIDYDDPEVVAEAQGAALDHLSGDVKAWYAFKQAEAEAADAMAENASRAHFNKYEPTHRIPILGRISAGLPLYADENIEGYAYTDLNGSAEYFALRVTGDSMNLLRMYEGDLLIVRRQDQVENGDIAVVLVNDTEAVVKRFHRHEHLVTLIPQSTNKAHKIQIYDTWKTRICVLGKVVRNQIDY